MFALPPAPPLSWEEIQARLRVKEREGLMLSIVSSGFDQKTESQPASWLDSKAFATKPSLSGKVKPKITSLFSLPSREFTPSVLDRVNSIESNEVTSPAATAMPTFVQIPFAESPRQVPVPPLRPKSIRPLSDLFLSELPGSFPPPPTPSPEGRPPPMPPSMVSSPSILAKLPLKRENAGRLNKYALPELPASFFTEPSLSTAMKQLHVTDARKRSLAEKPAPLPRSYSAPLSTERNDSLKLLTLSPNRAGSVRTAHTARKRSSRTSGVLGDKIDKVVVSRRMATGSSMGWSGFLSDSDDLAQCDSLDEENRAVVIRRMSVAAAPGQMPRRRRRKGETMSMLLNSGFFPVQELIYSRSGTAVNAHGTSLPSLRINDKELPDTPKIIIATPMELRQSAPIFPRQEVRNGILYGKDRSTLSQISTSDAKAKNPPLPTEPEEVSLSRLSTMSEQTSVSENISPRQSGVTAPVATAIHLRSGSIITVTPPELTAWKCSVYIQGPIKLLKPAVLPRKNTVASLEPFQEAIELVYQNALNIHRRRSDDAVKDDICDFFDQFSFDDFNFEGDKFEVAEIEVAETEIDRGGPDDGECFSNPPLDLPAASPIKKIIASKMIESMSKPLPVPSISKLPRQPVDDMEALRAKGIARLSRTSSRTPISQGACRRKDSSTVGMYNGLNLLPMPEHGILEAALSPLQSNFEHEAEEQVGDSGFDWDDDVEETDARSSWLGPTTAAKKHPVYNARQARNPVAKMRRMMQTASAIL